MAEISTRSVAAAGGGALLAVALAFVGSADASHRYDETARCNGRAVHDVQIVARTSEATAFIKLKPASGQKRRVSYACLRRGPVRQLDRPSGGNYVRGWALAGRYVAFKRFLYLSEFGSASEIRVLDLSTGETKVAQNGVPDYTGDSHVLALVVKRNGSVAWTGVGDRGPDGSVWKVDATGGGPQRLDAGPELDYDSLALAADRRSVIWRNGSEARSAPID